MVAINDVAALRDHAVTKIWEALPTRVIALALAFVTGWLLNDHLGIKGDYGERLSTLEGINDGERLWKPSVEDRIFALQTEQANLREKVAAVVGAD